MNARKILLLAAYFLTALLAVTASKGYYPSDKRTNERQFMVGMRYGRSEKTAKASGKHVIVAPRADKFFLASRYGKRSGDSINPSLVYPVAPPCGNDDDLKCTYSGVSNIYRCIQSMGKGNNVLTASM